MKQEKIKHIRTVIVIGVIVCFLTMVACTGLISNAIISNVMISDMDAFLKKKNVSIQNGYIVEHLNDVFVIKNKWLGKEKGRYGMECHGADVYFFRLRNDKLNMDMSVSVSVDDYNKYDVGDSVLLSRDVYYTTNGVRLRYIDTISPL